MLTATTDLRRLENDTTPAALAAFVRHARRSGQDGLVREFILSNKWRWAELVAACPELALVMGPHFVGRARHTELAEVARDAFGAGLELARYPKASERVMSAPWTVSRCAAQFKTLSVAGQGALVVTVYDSTHGPRCMVTFYTSSMRRASAVRTRLRNLAGPGPRKVSIKQNPYDLTQGGWSDIAVTTTFEMSDPVELADIADTIVRPLFGFLRWLATRPK